MSWSPIQVNNELKRTLWFLKAFSPHQCQSRTSQARLQREGIVGNEISDYAFKNWRLWEIEPLITVKTHYDSKTFTKWKREDLLERKFFIANSNEASKLCLKMHWNQSFSSGYTWDMTQVLIKKIVPEMYADKIKFCLFSPFITFVFWYDEDIKLGMKQKPKLFSQKARSRNVFEISTSLDIFEYAEKSSQIWY